ncbi:MAG: glycosyltransferase family 39 protein [Candidatus Sumerlaeaceae bacterium]
MKDRVTSAVVESPSLAQRRLNRWLLAAIFVIALSFRLHDITRAPWIDEILTYDAAKESIKQALTTKWYPLSYVLVNFCLRLSDSDFMLRLPSLVVGLLGIWLIYRAGCAIYNCTAGLIAALLLAVVSTHVVYSQEARFYSMLAAASIFTSWMLWKALLTARAAYWLGFAASIVIGSLIQPLYLLFLAGGSLAAVGWLSLRARRNPGSAKELLKLGISLVVGLLPVGLFYLQYRAKPGVGTLLALQPAGNEILYRIRPHGYIWYLYELVNSFPPTVVEFFIICAGIGLVVLWRQSRPVAVVCLGFIFLCPLPMFFVTIRHWYASKYFIAQLPLFFLLAATGMAAISGYLGRYWNRYAAPAAFTCLCTFVAISPQLVEYRTYAGRMRFKIREWHNVAQPMIGRMSGQDLIVHLARYRWTVGFGRKGTPIEWYELQRYLERSTPAGRLPLHPTRYFGTTNTLQLLQVLKTNSDRTIWVVVDRAAGFQLEPALANLLTTETSTFRHRLFSAGEPTRNLVIQPVIAKQDDPSPYRFSCEGGTSISLAVRRSQKPVATKDEFSTAPVLDRTEAYTLSANVKYRGIRPDADKNEAGEPVMNEATAGFIGISGSRADGTTFSKKLRLFDGSSDWKQIALPLRPIDDADLADARQLTVDFGVGDVQGQMRVDEVQLEAKDHVTPFTPNERLPRDQALASR